MEKVKGRLPGSLPVKVIAREVLNAVATFCGSAVGSAKTWVAAASSVPRATIAPPSQIHFTSGLRYA